MKKQRRRATVKNNISWPALAALLLCAAAYMACLKGYYGSHADIRHLLISAQLPLLRGVPYPAEAPAPIPSPAPAPEPEPAEVRIEISAEARPPETTIDGTEPRILIYHTHATEAYFKLHDEEYEDNGRWRTRENDKNIIAVGAKLARLLREEYGISVIHDVTNHEPPKLATAYSRSVATMEKYREEYPSITMYIDVHRDSYGNDPTEPQDYVTIAGKECARMMCVVGTGKGATGTGYGEMPDFESNYALAEHITNTLAGVDEGLVRDIRVKTGRYNQHISNQCLLVEVGHNANTLQQALNSIDHLAAAIAGALDGEYTGAGGQLSFSP